MRFIKTFAITACVVSLLACLALAGEKQQTCCEKAAAEGKECSHRCCVAAHHEGKSCEKCNPNKEDLKFIKKKAEPDKSDNSGQIKQN